MDIYADGSPSPLRRVFFPTGLTRWYSQAPAHKGHLGKFLFGVKGGSVSEACNVPKDSQPIVFGTRYIEDTTPHTSSL
jgi:hypothetical protein